MKKRLLAVFLLGMLLLGMVPAEAAVVSTTEATGGKDNIYVVGNPDWYPFEYYDRETEQYEGILPEVLERISERSGLQFTYILAGEEDHRFDLAKNGQAEMISGCAETEQGIEANGLRKSPPILTLTQEGERISPCFAFTEIADAQLIRKIETALGAISGQELAEITAGFMMTHGKQALPADVFRIGVVIFAAMAILLLILLLRLRYYRKSNVPQEWYDQTTGIGNKLYFAERFEKDIPNEYRGLYGVFFIGFDLTRANQYYGEAAVDAQLCFAAETLTQHAKDREIVARVNGGIVVTRPSSNEREAEEWMRQTLEELNRYTERYGKDYHPDFYGGIYMLHPADRDHEEVLFSVRQGYQTAVSKGIPYAFSRREQLEKENEKLQLKKQIMEAIRNREFCMFLQFIVSGKTGEIVSAEALSRWAHPKRGLLYPGKYIELMEEEKTISELDFYLFEEACKQLEQWQKEGQSMHLTCNFARITIGQKNFFQRLQKIAERYVFDHGSLILEITEDTVEDSRKTAFQNISRCKEMGFGIALDDVGSGYTFFSDLRDYPIDVVKIDRSILNSAIDGRGTALLKGMIALAHSLQMKVLCEGVETEGQVKLLQQLDCDYIQGYYFYRALPLQEAERVLREQVRRQNP